VWRLADNAGGAGGWGGDSHPGEEPQTTFDRADNQPATDDWLNKAGVEDYQFLYGNGQFHISDDHSLEDLASHASVSGDYAGPLAIGRVHVDMGKATFEVHSNIHAHGLARILKDYADKAGWKWGGMTDLQGQPVGTGSEFAPVSSVYIGVDSAGTVKIASLASKLETHRIRLRAAVHVEGKKGFLTGGLPREAWEGVKEWADDQGITLVGGNDNVLKRIEDLEIDNNYTPEWKNDAEHPLFQNEPDNREPSGVYKCPSCAKLFPSYRLYLQHRSEEDPITSEPNQDGKFPELNMDATFPPNVSEPLKFYEGAATVHPKDALQAPIPFLFDVQEDSIVIGHEGQRTSDIPGQFTPGGIVEGTYEPGGDVIIHSMTNMPYTVRHMLELWYYQHPELEVKNVQLKDQSGNSTKLAGTDIGGYITAIVGADPTAFNASRALMRAGGKVFVVGGAVRDAILGKEPKDVDLMVTGLPPNEVDEVLNSLPGRVDLTGKDFGVFRYNDKGGEVEIALPRRERSTGGGHKDFAVDADHTMTPEEDLYRRDFTANAMAVDLNNGKLIDPFHGIDDLKAGRLRTLNTKSLSDDPLRTVRALVAMSRHGLHPDPETREQMAENANLVQHLPKDRIQPELDKLFKGDDPETALRTAIDTGIMPFIFPEVDKAVGHSQNNPHHELDLGDHLLQVMTRAKEAKPDDHDFALAGLLHDIGKVDSHWSECRDCGWKAHGPHDKCPECGSENTSGHFYQHEPGIGKDHESVGADQARQRLNDLRYPKDRIDRITNLIQHHMFPGFTTEKGARRFLNTVGNHADDLLHLRWADQGGKSAYPTDPSLSVDQHRQLLQTVREKGQATNKSELAINGNDLIGEGMVPGPAIGQMLQRLTEAVIENPQLNTRDGLLGLVRAWQ
jgi:tRNA nucleotidyltransferase (CCA-adding enzyme)